MKLFINKISLFSLLLLIGNVGLLVMSNNLYTGPYEDYSLDFRSYLFADSHGLGIDSSSEKYGVYNFSAASDSYIDISRKISFLVKKNNLDTVYLTVDDHTLSSYREKMNNLDRSSFFASKEDFSNDWIFVKEKYFSRYIAFFKPKLGKLAINWSKAQLSSLGELKVDQLNWTEYSFEERVVKSRKRYNDQFESKHQSEVLKNELLKIVELCRMNNITLIGVRFPLTKEYSTLLGNHTFDAFGVFKGHGLQVLDYKDVYFNRPELFKDQDHLNLEGGKALSNDAFTRH